MQLNPDDYELAVCSSCQMSFWRDKDSSHQRLCSLCYKKRHNRNLNQSDIQIYLWQQNQNNSKAVVDLKSKLSQAEIKIRTLRKNALDDHNTTVKELNASKDQNIHLKTLLQQYKQRQVDLHTGKSSPVWGFFVHNKFLNLLIKTLHPDKITETELSKELFEKLLNLKKNKGEA